MAMRLGQWIKDELGCKFYDRDGIADEWNPSHVDMGILHMHIVSLHIFEGDMGKMRREAPPTP